MQENLITFETAKLAKEKGFNIPTISYYNPKGRSEESEGYMTERLECSNWNDGQGSYPTLAKDVECSAPTQSLLQKWLREVHNIHIEPQLSRNSQEEYKDWWFYLYPNLSGGRIKFFPSEIGEGLSYEKALEIGLQEALKLIPNKK